MSRDSEETAPERRVQPGGAATSGEHRLPGQSAEPPLPGQEVWWHLERMLRGLPPEIRPLVEHLQSRLLTEAESPAGGGTAEPVPDAASIAGAARVIRESIHEAAERGAPPSRVRLLHGHLDREIALLTKRLLEKRSTETRQVLRDVSHDIRSPLNSILFLADALISEHAGELNEVQRRQLGVLYTAAVSLVGLVNDIIDASRLGDGSEIPVSHDSFSVEGVLKELERLVGPLAQHRGVTLGFRLETLGPRSGDRRLLTRVLINLVSNAIQVADAGGRVEVRAAEQEEGWLQLEVLDDGPGGDPAELRRMLEAETAPTPTEPLKRGWTHGLGLSICSRLVRATGGDISVDAPPGESCQFTIRLPFPRL